MQRNTVERRTFWIGFILIACAAPVVAADANRLAYLNDPANPYYVGRDFPKLTTPQWVGEKGVEAVVVLAIDDMRDPAAYEAFLRPILDRLKKINGRAAVSIMTCSVDPTDSRLTGWLDEGLSIEAHTVDHPCPLLHGSDLAKAKSTYDRCVDLLSTIPGNKPVAFRMPCCDSRNTPSPRFWTEIFNRSTPGGNHLQIDSSVFQLFTPQDPELPREIVRNETGEERFRRYIPFPSFVNTIEDYPYPYVIGRTCWEFPCMVPSDWEAQNIQRPFNPDTLRDLKLALDATVIKQGTFNLVFHPHGWIRNDQVVEFIDYAMEKYDGRVTFLTFPQALQRLNQYLLDRHSLRDEDGNDSGARLLDINHDGYLDVVIPDKPDSLITRIWSPKDRTWRTFRQTLHLVRPRFAVTSRNQPTTMFVVGPRDADFTVLTFVGDRWQEVPITFALSQLKGHWQDWVLHPRRLDVIRFHDVDGDGLDEMILAKGEENLILKSTDDDRTWRPLPFTLPAGVRLTTEAGDDAGLRFVDINEDGFDDVLYSAGDRYSLHLFESASEGWTTTVIDGKRGRHGNTGPEIPLLVRPDGSSNGAWFHSGHLWVQNEFTDRLPDGVDRIAFADMLKELGRQPVPPDSR